MLLTTHRCLHTLIATQKQDEDRDGGEAIRNASLKSSGSKSSKRDHISPSTDNSDAENIEPDTDRVIKRVRRGGSFDKRMGKVEDLLTDSLTSQRKHQKEMMAGFKAANEAHAANSRALIELLDRKL